MSSNICTSSTHTTACSGEIDPMVGSTIPTGINAIETFINGNVVWQTNPPQPPETIINFLVQQNGGKILIDDGIVLGI